MKKNKSFLLLFLSVLMAIGMIHMPAQAAEKGTVVIKCAESKKGISDATFALYAENVPGKKSGRITYPRSNFRTSFVFYSDGNTFQCRAGTYIRNRNMNRCFSITVKDEAGSEVASWVSNKIGRAHV